jgi:site-specific DNA recombinase
VLSGAPFGYRYIRKTDLAGAPYEVIEGEAALVAEMFRRYADDGATIADLARWMGSAGAVTRTGKHRWDRSVIWGMLRNPAYAGTAVFGKTQIIHEQPGLNRVARLQGRSVPRAVKTVDRPREEWLQIPVPAIVDTGTFARAGQRLEDNKRFAARNTKVPSLLQGLAACSACGYGYYRTSARTTSRKIYYYRCLGSDDYRYEGGRVCGNQPVRADYLDTVVWDHITGLLADPALIRAEISKRLEQARTADPATRQRKQLELALAKASTGITAMIEAYSEQLITIDELRARMPHLRARETSLRGQIDALDAQLADRDACLTLAGDLEGFLAQLRGNAATATVEDRQRVLRLLVKDILIGPEKITIRHRIPTRPGAPAPGNASPDPIRRVTIAGIIYCVGGAFSPLLANIYLHVLDRELSARGVGELVRYADDGVVLCRTQAQARAALDAAGEILGSLGLRLHPGKTKVVDLREGREGLDFPRLPFSRPHVGAAMGAEADRPLLPAPVALAAGDETAPGEGPAPYRP